MKALFGLLIFISLLLSACGSGSQSTSTPVSGSESLTVSSPAFASMEAIPAKYACGGDEISIPLAWSGVPEGTKSLALIMDDPDAPVGTWVHWVVYNLPPETTSLPEGAAKANSTENTLPAGAQHGSNSWQRADYGGPCPPSGQHRYFFRLYALDTTLDLTKPGKDALLKAMEGHIIAQGELVGVYKK